MSACQAIETGDAEVALAGGAESMSRGPYWVTDARWGAKMGPAPLTDPVMGGLTDPFHEILMGVTAENLAERYSISRDEQDEFAVESHRRASAAQSEGRFDDQIVPVPVKVKRETVAFVHHHEPILSRDKEAMVWRIRNDVIPAPVTAQRVRAYHAVGGRLRGEGRRK